MLERPDRARRVEILIASLLRYGVLLCAGLIAVGWAAGFLFDGQTAFSTFLAQLLAGGLVDAPPPFLSWEGLGTPRGTLLAGLFLLVLLPVTRVAFTLVAFALEKDLIYVCLSSIVLAVLLLGLLFGHGF